MESEPYYRSIHDTQQFINHYKSLYSDSYSRNKVAAFGRLFSQPEIGGKRILDVGCGGGFYSTMMTEMGAKEVLSVDLQKVCVKSCHGVVASSTNLPFATASFDVVVCIDVIEHVGEDEQMVHELARALKPHGLLLISTQNSLSLNYLLEGLIHLLKGQKWVGWDPTHLRFYNCASLFKMLEEFEVLRIAGTYFLPYSITKAQTVRTTLQRVNQIFENRCDRVPWKVCGWGIGCLCRKCR